MRRLEADLAAARRELRDAMLEAKSRGETIQSMADVLGVSRQRAARILDEAN